MGAVAQEPVMPVSLGHAMTPAAIEGLPVRPAAPAEFSHAWLGKTDAVRRAREQLDARGLLDGATPTELSRLGAALEGTLRIPVIAVRYADVAAPFPVSRLSERLFGPVRGDTMSLATYWREVSGGLLDVQGVVTSWVRLGRSASHYLSADDYGWGRVGRIGEFRQQALERADRAIDFTRFDNDGPDGIPDSGDDDGHVDLVVFYYATGCDQDERAGGLWPHRGTMAPYPTGDRAADGRSTVITDYVVLPAQEPGGCEPAHVGVLAHETAHALGLPDLYDYDGSSRGIGSWGLMGTGSHARSHSPAHLAAWAREQLGWVRVDWTHGDGPAHVSADRDTPRVVRHEMNDGSGRYLLMEYRSRRGSDRHLPGHGLLVWGVHPERGELGSWNTDERSPAVALLVRGPDGGLVTGGGHDGSGPYPGSPTAAESEVAALPGPSFPAAIEVVESVDQAQVTVRPLDAPSWEAPLLRLAVLEGSSPLRRSLHLRNPAAEPWVARARPDWLRLTRTPEGVDVEIDAGSLEPGIYTDSIALVNEVTGQVLDRVEVVLDVLAPGLASVVPTDVSWGWGLAVRDDELIHPGAAMDAFGLRPRPRLLRMGETDAVSRTLARLPVEALYAPAVHGDEVYVIGRARDRNYVYRVGPDGEAAVLGGGVAGEPAYGLAVLPQGGVLVAGWTGRLTRVAEDGSVTEWADVGQPIYQIAAGPDGRVYAALLSGEVLEVRPDGHLTRLETGFGKGRLVALAVSADGRVFAAERGGDGRIVEPGESSPRPVARIAGAAFYGVAVGDTFIYALDLGNGQLVRVPIPSPDAPRPPTIAAGS